MNDDRDQTLVFSVQTQPQGNFEPEHGKVGSVPPSVCALALQAERSDASTDLRVQAVE